MQAEINKNTSMHSFICYSIETVEHEPFYYLNKTEIIPNHACYSFPLLDD